MQTKNLSIVIINDVLFRWVSNDFVDGLVVFFLQLVIFLNPLACGGVDA